MCTELIPTMHVLCISWQAGAAAETKHSAVPSRKVTLPESLDDWDDFDLTLSITKNKQKPNDSPVTKPAVSHATAAAVPVISRKKSLFDDDDDDDFL